MKKLITILFTALLYSSLVTAALTLVFNPTTSKLDYVGLPDGTNQSFNGTLFLYGIPCITGQSISINTTTGMLYCTNSTTTIYNGSSTNITTTNNYTMSVTSINSSYIIITNDSLNVNLTLNMTAWVLFLNQFYINSSTAASTSSANWTTYNAFAVNVVANGTTQNTFNGQVVTNITQLYGNDTFIYGRFINITNNINTSTNIENLGFNTTSKLITFFNTLFNNTAFMTAVVGNFSTQNLFNVNVVSNTTTQNALNLQFVANRTDNNTFTLAYANLKNFNTGCPDGSYQINDSSASRTCKVIPGSDITNTPWSNFTSNQATNTTSNPTFGNVTANSLTINDIIISPRKTNYLEFKSIDFEGFSFTGQAAQSIWYGATILSGGSIGTSVNVAGTSSNPGIMSFTQGSGQGAGFFVETVSGYQIGGGESTCFILQVTGHTGNVSYSQLGFSNEFQTALFTPLTNAVTFIIVNNTILGSNKNSTLQINTTTNYTLTFLSWYEACLFINPTMTNTTFYLYNLTNGLNTLLWKDNVTNSIPNTTNIQQGFRAGTWWNGSSSNNATSNFVVLNLDYMDVYINRSLARPSIY